MTTHPILDLGQRWAAAEQRGDASTLDALSMDDFTMVGPFGFVLTKQQWLDRYRDGDLVTAHLEWHDVAVRDHGAVAVAIGVHTQRAAYRGRPNDGSFRATHVAVCDEGEWKLAGIHMSPMPPADGSRPPAAASGSAAPGRPTA
jgi:ketosteroid isomerase-like protein